MERLSSHSGAVEVVFKLDEGRPVYAVTYKRKVVVTMRLRTFHSNYEKAFDRISVVQTWRDLTAGDEPGRLVESTIILSLNDPPAFDPSWVRPGGFRNVTPAEFKRRTRGRS